MKKLFLAIFVIAIVQLSLAQDEKDALRKAAKYYKNLDYIEAIAAYESIARKGVEPQELLENLGNCYYYNADYQQANKWYAKHLQAKIPKGNLLTSSPNIITAMHKLLKVKVSMKSLTK